MGQVRFPGGPRRLTAAEINRWNKLTDAQARGELKRRGIPTAKTYDPSSRVALVRNDSGADRQAFECMALDGMLWDLETDGSSGLIFKVDTADPDKPPAILVAPIANGAIGRAVVDGLALALVQGGSGDYAAPNASGHNLEPGSGSIRLLSQPHASTTRLLPVTLGSSSGSDNHYLFTLTGAISGGSGAATIRNMADDTEIETGATVVDTLGHFDGLASGRRGICILSGGTYYALTPWVSGVRWDAPDLEYTKDGGSNWINIDTATSCP